MKEKIEKFKKLANSFGFVIPKNAEFYIVKGETAPFKNLDNIGMKVGEYTHSCHVDTTDIIVLLFIDEDGKDTVSSYCEPWIRKIE